MLDANDVWKALGRVRDPATGKSVTEAGLISGVTVRSNGRVGFLITVAPERAQASGELQAECERALAALAEVTSVTAVLTAEMHPDGRNTPPVERVNKDAALSARAPARWNREKLPHVRRIVAVASGKGGVGKSTTSVNLAHAFCALGQRTGLLDADVTGPSLPRMMHLKASPEVMNGRIIPSVSYGIAVMSMGLLVGEGAALVWRGPQLSKALAQLLRGVEWGTQDAPLDILLIDMPPGTGDLHLSLAQQAPIDGAIIVTTPQDVAVADARKCIDMFRKVEVPVMGIIENMSGFTDPVSGAIHAIFGTGGGERLAQECGLAYLGAVPIEISLRAASDAGEKWEDAAGIYRAIALQLLGT